MKFFKLFWAVLLATIVSGLLGFIFWLIVILVSVGAISGGNVTPLLPNSILEISLSEIFTDAPQSDPLAQIDYTTMEIIPSISLIEALTAIEAAESDPNIEAIYLNISATAAVPLASLEELREALAKFKKSGKSIIAYNDTYSQSGYYLSTIADKIYAHPEGMMMWQGMATNTMFYKGLLDKLDISVEVFRPTVCKYKSAVEPYILSKMSEANRAQMQQLLNSMWATIASDVALARGLTLEDVNRIADNLECMDVDKALECRMIDGLIYPDQLPAIFREAGANIATDDEQINYIDFTSYVALKGTPLSSYSAAKVAIIYAEGGIVDGEGYDAKVYGDSTAEIIRQARNDESIKAVVLRVNSPGGSALASDIMWRELELLRAEKPLIVSMGAYAASGGYYISAPADVIVANRLTLTGSIGVFGMIPNIEGGLKSQLGITMDGVETNSSAAFLKTLGSMSQFERSVMVKNVDKVYTRFTSLVSEGRNLPLEQVLEIAQGRVWSGTEAVELGLADTNGGLRDAIAIAVDKAGIADNFRIVELLDEPTGIAALFASTEARIKATLSESILPASRQQTDLIKSAIEPLITRDGMVMHSPYRVDL